MFSIPSVQKVMIPQNFRVEGMLAMNMGNDSMPNLTAANPKIMVTLAVSSKMNVVSLMFNGTMNKMPYMQNNLLNASSNMIYQSSMMNNMSCMMTSNSFSNANNVSVMQVVKDLMMPKNRKYFMANTSPMMYPW